MRPSRITEPLPSISRLTRHEYRTGYLSADLQRRRYPHGPWNPAQPHLSAWRRQLYTGERRDNGHLLFLTERHSSELSQQPDLDRRAAPRGELAQPPTPGSAPP